MDVCSFHQAENITLCILNQPKVRIFDPLNVKSLQSLYMGIVGMCVLVNGGEISVFNM